MEGKDLVQNRLALVVTVVTIVSSIWGVILTVDSRYAKNERIVTLKKHLSRMERQIRLNELHTLKYRIQQIRYAGKEVRNSELEEIEKNLSVRIEKLQEQLEVIR